MKKVRFEVHPEWWDTEEGQETKEAIKESFKKRVSIYRKLEKELDIEDEELDYPDLGALNELVDEELEKLKQNN